MNKKIKSQKSNKDILLEVILSNPVKIYFALVIILTIANVFFKESLPKILQARLGNPLYFFYTAITISISWIEFINKKFKDNNHLNKKYKSTTLFILLLGIPTLIMLYFMLRN